MATHAVGVAGRRSDAVLWVCSHKVGAGRIAKVGASAGLRVDNGVMRVELVDTLEAYALAVTAERAAGRRAIQGAAAA